MSQLTNYNFKNKIRKTKYYDYYYLTKNVAFNNLFEYIHICDSTNITLLNWICSTNHFIDYHNYFISLIFKYNLLCKPYIIDKNKCTSLINAIRMTSFIFGIKLINNYGVLCYPTIIDSWKISIINYSSRFKLNNITNKIILIYGKY
jgi:hypothetical protein